MRSFSEAGHVRGPDRGGLSHPSARGGGGLPAGRFPPPRGRGGRLGSRIGCSPLWRQNMEELRQASPPPTGGSTSPSSSARRSCEAHARELRERARLGLARDGHGDLRCEHVLARPTIRVVDRIEFDPGLRRTDIACDLAFLAMDLEAHGQRWAARELAAAYREAGMSPGSDALRSFYAAHWALVRTKVALIAAAEHDRHARAERLRDAERLWALSERLCWRARAPLALVVCGPAATGKSMLAGSSRAARSCRSSPPTPCASAWLTSLPFQAARPEHYSARFTAATYEQLTRDALLALSRGDGVIVDATCRSRRDRARLLDSLRAAGVTTPDRPLRGPAGARAEACRTAPEDPQRVSDATPQIAEEQFRAFEEFDERSEGNAAEARYRTGPGRTGSRDRACARRARRGTAGVTRTTARSAEIRRNTHPGAGESPMRRPRAGSSVGLVVVPQRALAKRTGSTHRASPPPTKGRNRR